MLGDGVGPLGPGDPLQVLLAGSEGTDGDFQQKGFNSFLREAYGDLGRATAVGAPGD